MKIVTAGERLFYLIRDKVLDALIFEGKKWSDLKGVLAGAGGKLEVEQYIKGAMAVHAMRKLLRYWDNEHSICSEVMGIKNVASFIREEIFIGLSNTIASELARAVIAAHSASGKRIGNEVKSSILRRTLRPRCYLCDQQLDTTALLGDPRFFTLEHLWPSSIGGDSVEENLIPACEKCQKVTQDTMSWEWFNMQNLVLPIEPSESALTSVDWKARYAIHFHQALCLAEQANLTLKDAFIQLGRIRANIGYRKTVAKKSVIIKTLQFPAFAFEQRIATGPMLVMFHATVSEVKKFSTVEHLGPTSKGAQREKKPARITAIKKFLDIDPQNTIPTALILAFKPGKASVKSKDGRTTLSIEATKKSSVVVDGQHRLEGIFEFDPNMAVPIVALLDANEVETAFQFLVVNNKSSKVAPAHTKALLAKMRSTGLAKRLRDAKLSFDADGINDIDLINTDADSPFFQTIDWTTTPETKRIIQATAIELSLDYLSNIGLEDFDDRDVRRSVFLVMWSRIKLEMPTLWKKDSRLISKVGIFCLSRFIIDRIVNWADNDELNIDVTDLQTIEEQTGKILQYMDAKFWTTKWAEKASGGFDTAQGRERVYDAITQMYRNGRKDIPWHSDIEILDRATAAK